MKTTPRTLKMNPIEFAVPNLTAFFMINKKAFQAAAQKFLPVNAIYLKRKRLKK
jgi:hypothetical protein